MLVFHHHAFDSRKRPADDHNTVASNQRRNFILPHNDVFVAGFYDDFETLHLPFGDGEEIVGAVGIGGKMIVIWCHSSEEFAVLKQGAKVVQCGAQEQKSCVQGLVGDVLCGVVEIFVGVFDVAEEREIRFEVVVFEGDEFVVNLLCAMVRGANWKPVSLVWQKGNPNRLPEIVVLSFGIRADILIRCRAVGRAAMELVQNRHCC